MLRDLGIASAAGGDQKPSKLEQAKQTFAKNAENFNRLVANGFVKSDALNGTVLNKPKFKKDDGKLKEPSALAKDLSKETDKLKSFNKALEEVLKNHPNVTTDPVKRIDDFFSNPLELGTRVANAVIYMDRDGNPFTFIASGLIPAGKSQEEEQGKLDALKQRLTEKKLDEFKAIFLTLDPNIRVRLSVCLGITTDLGNRTDLTVTPEAMKTIDNVDINSIKKRLKDVLTNYQPNGKDRSTSQLFFIVEDLVNVAQEQGKPSNPLFEMERTLQSFGSDSVPDDETLLSEFTQNFDTLDPTLQARLTAYLHIRPRVAQDDASESTTLASASAAALASLAVKAPEGDAASSAYGDGDGDGDGYSDDDDEGSYSSESFSHRSSAYEESSYGESLYSDDDDEGSYSSGSFSHRSNDGGGFRAYTDYKIEQSEELGVGIHAHYINDEPVLENWVNIQMAGAADPLSIFFGDNAEYNAFYDGFKPQDQRCLILKDEDSTLGKFTYEFVEGDKDISDRMDNIVAIITKNNNDDDSGKASFSGELTVRHNVAVVDFENAAARSYTYLTKQLEPYDLEKVDSKDGDGDSMAGSSVEDHVELADEATHSLQKNSLPASGELPGIDADAASIAPTNLPALIQMLTQDLREDVKHAAAEYNACLLNLKENRLDPKTLALANQKVFSEICALLTGNPLDPSTVTQILKTKTIELQNLAKLIEIADLSQAILEYNALPNPPQMKGTLDAIKAKVGRLPKLIKATNENFRPIPDQHNKTTLSFLEIREITVIIRGKINEATASGLEAAGVGPSTTTAAAGRTTTGKTATLISEGLMLNSLKSLMSPRTSSTDYSKILSDIKLGLSYVPPKEQANKIADLITDLKIFRENLVSVTKSTSDRDKQLMKALLIEAAAIAESKIIKDLKKKLNLLRFNKKIQNDEYRRLIELLNEDDEFFAAKLAAETAIAAATTGSSALGGATTTKGGAKTTKGGAKTDAAAARKPAAVGLPSEYPVLAALSELQKANKALDSIGKSKDAAHFRSQVTQIKEHLSEIGRQYKALKLENQRLRAENAAFRSQPDLFAHKRPQGESSAFPSPFNHAPRGSKNFALISAQYGRDRLSPTASESSASSGSSTISQPKAKENKKKLIIAENFKKVAALESMYGEKGNRIKTTLLDETLKLHKEREKVANLGFDMSQKIEGITFHFKFTETGIEIREAVGFSGLTPKKPIIISNEDLNDAAT